MNARENPRHEAQASDFCRRLDAQLGRMPISQREEIQREIGQHLEALALAYREVGVLPGEAVEEVLGQMGDPTQIGRRLHREWKLAVRQERRAQWTPVRYAVNWLLGTSVLSLFVFIPLLARLDVAWRPTDHALIVAPPLLAGALTGWRWPNHAVPVIIYAVCRVMIVVTLLIFFALFACNLIMFVLGPSGATFSADALMKFIRDAFARPSWLDLLPFLLWLGLWLLLGCLSAYLMSAFRRREWYVPCLADWKKVRR